MMSTSSDWYLQNIAPVLQGEGVAVLDHFLLFLSRDLPEVYQRLRCRVLYHALLFTSETLGLGANAVERLHAEGPYAIDYLVSLESDFFMTNKRSSIAVLLRGHRFYMGAQKETYQPFVPALLPALAQGAAGQEELRQRVREHRKQVAELPIKSSRWHFYDRPWECVCH
ncbi:unnamed protein product [Closterium sp. Naga37s-1]|nr:unnamed protein product [Closterium sp. Naga37s-1]